MKRLRPIDPSDFYPAKKIAKTGLSAEQRARIAANRRAAQSLASSRGWTRTSTAWIRSLPGSGETKYNDSTFTFTTTIAGTIPTLTSVSPSAAAPINPAGQSLCLITQGTGKNQRNGNKMDLYQIRMNGLILLPSTTIGDTVRLMLVRDKQCNGDIADIDEVLEQAGATVATGLAIHSYRNMDNIQRFDILKDKEIRINPTLGLAGTSSTPVFVPFKMNHKLKSHQEIAFSSTTGVISEIRSTNYFLLVCSAVGVAQLNGTSRVYWKDK